MNTFTGLFRLTATILFLTHGIANALDNLPDDISGWTEQGIVLSHGATGNWDEKASNVKPVGAYKKDGVFYLHYIAGFEGCWNEDSDVNHQSLGLATSTDGVNFTKHTGNPVLKPHDFVSVSSHEEGIRGAAIRYLPDLEMWLGYFGVESPGGANTCPFMGSTSQCSCNIGVDSSIFAATSNDGINWTVQGEVNGVFNGEENYIDDFQYQGGQYYVWSHRAQGGQKHNASKGPDYMNLNPLGEVPELCFGWSNIHTVLHDDGETVTPVYDPNGGCAGSGNDLFFATTSLVDMTDVANVRQVHSFGQRHNFILKDTDAGIWRWYYNVTSGTDAGTIQLRTHPIIAGDNLPPGSTNPVTVD